MLKKHNIEFVSKQVGYKPKDRYKIVDLTLGVKNVYGCLPRSNKVAVYHIRHEIFDVTARTLFNLSVHFSFIDAWEGSDG